MLFDNLEQEYRNSLGKKPLIMSLWIHTMAAFWLILPAAYVLELTRPFSWEDCKRYDLTWIAPKEEKPVFYGRRKPEPERQTVSKTKAPSVLIEKFNGEVNDGPIVLKQTYDPIVETPRQLYVTSGGRAHADGFFKKIGDKIGEWIDRRTKRLFDLVDKDRRRAGLYHCGNGSRIDWMGFILMAIISVIISVVFSIPLYFLRRSMTSD